MRLSLDTDAAKAFRAFARRTGLPTGAAASELIRRGLRYEIGFSRRNGIAVFEAPKWFPSITTEQVRELTSEE